MSGQPETTATADETKHVTTDAGEEAKGQTKTPTATETATAAASNVASNAAAAASGVKDSVFSMFGGGGTKSERKAEDDEEAKNEPSGSSKAKKDDEEDVSILYSFRVFKSSIEYILISVLIGQSGGRGSRCAVRASRASD